ncbi:hypothetical protein MUU53_10220 [Rhizobium lemnae]|uniref:Uncharacterized protein n=1 Tax=Rhizobium lemnae TaxID=1214924 RepID=A0ABV8E7B3_9HYPH|nr:hypothetical protein [Rhizobium lemnae]MCJ8508288.1 hypothetical protein [Rhizobium lemnae]
MGSSPVKSPGLTADDDFATKEGIAEGSGTEGRDASPGKTGLSVEAGLLAEIGFAGGAGFPGELDLAAD